MFDVSGRAAARRTNLLILSVVFFLMILLTLGLREIANAPTDYEDFTVGMSTGETTVIIENGDSGEVIARKLESAGVIASWQKFFQLAISDPRASRIAPGTYSVETRLPVSQALEQLLDLERIKGLIVLRDGVRLSEVVDILAKNGFTGIDEALRALEIPEPFSFKSPEGFLYPAKYSFEPGTDTDGVLAAFIERFVEAMSGVDWTPQSANRIITIASLVEAEGTPDVFPRVARVILNRLEQGMPLQLDSTVHYIQNSRGEISLSLRETEIDNPYNTYRYRGLPPGPIGSPTRAAVDAVISPEEGDWMYFITVAPNDTRFTASYEEFLEWKRLYRENYRKGIFDD